MRNNQPVTDRELRYTDDIAIISHTDAKGLITFVNDDFVEISGFSQDELIGQSHNLVRHPDMPAEAFRDLWETVKAGRPWAGIVKNRCKNGDYYWVRASVTPKLDGGYLSVRVRPSDAEISAAKALYARMLTDHSIRFQEGQLKNTSYWRWIDNMRIGNRLALVMALIMVLLIGALVDGQLSAQKIENEYRAYIEGSGVRRIGFYNMYAQGLQMGQATRNIMLDPDNPKAYDNYKTAAESFDKAAETMREHDSRLFKSGLPEKIQAVRAVQKALHDRIFTAIKATQADEAKSILNKEETPKWRDMRQMMLDEIKRLDEAVPLLLVDLQTRSANARTRSILFAIGAVVLGILLGGILLARIARQARDAAAIVAAVAGGDLTRVIHPGGRDEFGSILVRVAMLRNRLHEAISLIHQAARSLDQVSQKLGLASNATVESVSAQSSAITSIAAAVEELSVATDEMSNNARQALQATDDSVQATRKSATTSREATEHINAATRVVADSELRIAELATMSEDIGRVVSVIKEIADQTNLLALNAAIEAARAGEQGRGFAVVADEVRKLAERTTTSTKQVAEVIAAIQNETRHAVDAMHRVVEQVTTNATSARQAGESIVQIREGSNRVVEVSAEIDNALKEQSSASELISKKVEVIASMSEENTSAMSETREASAEMKRLSAEMHDMVDRFKV